MCTHPHFTPCSSTHAQNAARQLSSARTTPRKPSHSLKLNHIFNNTSSICTWYFFSCSDAWLSCGLLSFYVGMLFPLTISRCAVLSCSGFLLLYGWLVGWFFSSKVGGDWEYFLDPEKEVSLRRLWRKQNRVSRGDWLIPLTSEFFISILFLHRIELIIHDFFCFYEEKFNGRMFILCIWADSFKKSNSIFSKKYELFFLM